MRRFREAHESVKLGDFLVARYKADEISALTTSLVDSASLGYHLPGTGGSLNNNSSLFAEQIDATSPQSIGSRAFLSGWWQGATSASVHNFFTAAASTQGFTVALWYKREVAASTAALFELSSTVSADLNIGACMPFGLYMLPSTGFRAVWDISPTCLAFAVDIPAPGLSTRPLHIGFSVLPLGTGFGQAFAAVNGRVMALGTVPLSTTLGTGSSARFVVGASRRFGTSGGDSAAFVVTGQVDDIQVRLRGLDYNGLRALYRDGARLWDERIMFETGQYRCQPRVWVKNATGTFVDLSSLYEVDWVTEVEVSASVDDPSGDAYFTLRRAKGDQFNLSPLAASALNQDDNGSDSALLDVRREVRIEVAAVPNEYKLSTLGWEFDTVFEGFIDSVEWGDEEVTVKCTDRMAVLDDTFQIDPRSYDYIDGSQPVVETHMQTVINNNSPRMLLGTATLTFRWLGGATPTVYTPASSGWALRYDDSPTGELTTILRGLADQIGWDLRYRWDDASNRFRLTFFEPPRALRLEVRRIEQDTATLQTLITTTVPHGLTAEQSVTIAGTVNYNGTTTVQRVISDTAFLCYQTPGAVAAETTGSVTYGGVVTVYDSRVSSFGRLQKDVTNIRNACLVKYKRDTTTVSIPIVYGGATVAGASVAVVFPPAQTQYLPYLETNQPFRIVSSQTSGFDNIDFRVGSFRGPVSAPTTGIQIVTSQVFNTTPVSCTSGAFVTEQIGFRVEFAAATQSIARYGLRQSAIYEATLGSIDTSSEAFALASRVVSDLAEPTSDVELTLDKAAHWLDLHDIITLPPDRKKRWTTAMTLAVTEYKHHYEAGNCYTTLKLRNAAPTLGTKWLKRIGVSDINPGRLPSVSTPPSLDGLRPIFMARHGNTLSGRLDALNAGNDARRRLLVDQTEIHLSTFTSDYTPNSATLVQTIRGNHFNITQDAEGNPLQPGTTYYLRFRHRDIWGQATRPTTATTFVVRHTDRAPGALVFFSSAVTTIFNGPPGSYAWYPIPFNNKTSSPAFDVYGNAALGGTGSVPLVTQVGVGAGTSHFFTMPCDGLCRVSFRVGLTGTTYGKGGTACALQFGVFRILSTLPGSSNTLPVVVFSAGAREGAALPGAGASSFTTLYLMGGSGSGPSSGFWSFSTDISANSGDRLTVGVDASDVLGATLGFMMARSSTFHSSTSFVQYTVFQN